MQSKHIIINFFVFGICFFLLTLNEPVYFWLGLGMLLLFTGYLNYQLFNINFRLWILPSSLVIGIFLMIFYSGDLYLKIGFSVLGLLLIISCYFLNQKRQPKSNLEIQRIFHYITIFFLLTGSYAILFYDIEKTQAGFKTDILGWILRLGVFIYVYILSLNFLATLPKTYQQKKNTYKMYISIIALITFQLFWLISLLPFRYRTSGLILFLAYYIIFEIYRFKVDPYIKRKSAIINLLVAIAGIVIILATSKWGY